MRTPSSQPRNYPMAHASSTFVIHGVPWSGGGIGEIRVPRGHQSWERRCTRRACGSKETMELFGCRMRICWWILCLLMSVNAEHQVNSIYICWSCRYLSGRFIWSDIWDFMTFSALFFCFIFSLIFIDIFSRQHTCIYLFCMVFFCSFVHRNPPQSLEGDSEEIFFRVRCAKWRCDHLHVPVRWDKWINMLCLHSCIANSYGYIYIVCIIYSCRIICIS